MGLDSALGGFVSNCCLVFSLSKLDHTVKFLVKIIRMFKAI